ncbi:MAG: hypothetical protein KGD59_04750 [Candidatus Heimdallarchaeota archaeon]|nr:hypothetical protein [Candidatus Heimdallarchaeota archaeon]
MIDAKRKILALFLLSLFPLTNVFTLTAFGLNGNDIWNNLSPNGLVNYFEDFVDENYNDDSATTAEGWGTGTIRNALDFTVEILDFYPTIQPVRGLDVQGRKAYVGGYNTTYNAQTLLILNISDSANMELMSFRDYSSHVGPVKVDGDGAYIGFIGGTLRINSYNVSNPYTLASTVYRDSIETDGLVTDIDIQGYLIYYTVYKSTSFRSIKLAGGQDIDNLDWLTFEWNSNKTLGIDVEGQIVYAAESDDGLYILDGSLRDPITELSHLNTPGNATDVLVDGQTAYIADGPAGVHIVDVSDTSNPVLLGSIDTPGNARRLAIQEDTLYVADGDGGVQVIDVTIPNAPVIITEIVLPYAWDLDLYGGDLIVGTDDGVYSIGIGAGMTDFSFAYPNAFDLFNVYDVRVRGDIAYLACGTDGLVTVDVGNPGMPVLLDNMTVSGGVNITKLDVDGRYAHLIEDGGSIYIYDISDPTNIVYAGGIGGGGLRDIFVRGQIQFVAFDVGFAIVNVSNPAAPTVLSNNFFPTTSLKGIWVQGQHAYLVDDIGTVGDGFLIYNVKDYTAPVLTDAQPRDSHHYDVYVDGDFAYLGGGFWMAMYNVTDPYDIQWTSFYTDYHSLGVWGFGPYILSADSIDGATLIDARNLNAAVTYNYPDATGALQITTHGDFTYIANTSNLLIMRHFRSAADAFDVAGSQAQSITIDDTEELIENVTLTFAGDIPPGTSIEFYLTSDGVNWESVTVGVKYTFTEIGSDLRWRAVFSGPVDHTARIFSMNILYQHEPKPPTPFGLIFGLLFGGLILIGIIVVTVLFIRKKKIPVR